MKLASGRIKRNYTHAKSPEEYLNQRTKWVGDCLEYTWGRDKNGYGQVHCAKVAKELKVSRAHQLAYVASKGYIPEGMLVCHTCDNPPCCNPEHLFLGTWDDNVQDMMRKGRYKHPETTNPHEQEIVAEWGKLTSTQVANKFGYSFSRICQIWREHGLTGRNYEKKINENKFTGDSA